MQKLADIIGVSRNYLSDYLLYIEKAGMIAQVRDATGGSRGLGKVEKIYLDNTNLIYILGGQKPGHAAIPVPQVRRPASDGVLRQSNALHRLR